MSLIDKVDSENLSAIGIFNIKSFDKNDNIIDEYTDKNLIVHTSRAAMAGWIGGFDSGPGFCSPINSFVLGTRGHLNNDILYPLAVGEEQTTAPGYGLFDVNRTQLFSEESGEDNFLMEFDARGIKDLTLTGVAGVMRKGKTLLRTDPSTNTVRRTIGGTRDNETTYVITIPIDNANMPGYPVAYTEAALYANEKLFAMKTFPARVKEDTVRFVITWTIVF